MKFSEYLKQLEEYEFESPIIVSYNNRCHVYRGEPNFYSKAVVADDFVVLNEHITSTGVGIKVLLSDEKKDYESVVLEILQLRHEKELERKKKARQELREYQEKWKKHEKRKKLFNVLLVLFFAVMVGLGWLLSRMG